MKCTVCEESVLQGVIDNGFVYCSQEHAEQDWRDERADQYARKESGGRYTNYEDFMECEHGILSYDDSENFDRGF